MAEKIKAAGQRHVPMALSVSLAIRPSAINASAASQLPITNYQ
jgi:hypothetical protein